MSFKLSQKSLSRLKGVDRDLIAVPKLAIKLTVIDFGIPPDGGLRSDIRQNELFLQGLSKADGYKKISEHQLGGAFDFYAYVDGKASWREDHLAMVACALLQAGSMLGVGLNWGGLWSSTKTTNGIPYGWDMGHIELG